jgi:hypothetical protein
MATKPVTTPQIWASNALYTTGPFIGQPSKVVPAGAVAAEGHRPGANFPTPAEYENQQQNRITDWIVSWLALGSSAGAADAHIVETDTTGRSALVGLDLNDAVDETVLNVTGVNTIAPTAVYTCTTGATVVQAAVGNSTGTAFSASVGTGAGTGLDATLAGSAAGGAGIRITTNGVCAADGIVLTCAAGHVGDGIIVDASAAGGTAISVLGSNARSAIDATAAGNQSAGQFTGAGLGSGIEANSGGTAGASGVAAQSLNNTGFGVTATVPVTATGAAAAVRAAGRGAGQGVTATAVTGAAVSASASNSAGVAIYMPGKAGDPSTFVVGSLDCNTVTSTLVTPLSGVYRDVRTSIGNCCTGGTVGNKATTAGAVNWQPAASFTLSAGDAPARVGRTLRLRFRCDARLLVANAGMTLNVQISRTAPGPTTILVSRYGTGFTDAAGYYMSEATTAWQRTIIIDFDYTIAFTGTHTFLAEILAFGGTDIRIRDAALLPEGLF